MTKIYIDTSVFYSALYADEFYNRAKKIMTDVWLGKLQGYTSSFTITELLFTLYRRGRGADEIKVALDTIFQHPNILVLSIGTTTFYESTNYLALGLEIGDALHAGAMKEFGITEIASFDSDFDKISEIKRISSV